jgi:hypothetical protein
MNKFSWKTIIRVPGTAAPNFAQRVEFILQIVKIERKLTRNHFRLNNRTKFEDVRARLDDLFGLHVQVTDSRLRDDRSDRMTFEGSRLTLPKISFVRENIKKSK